MMDMDRDEERPRRGKGNDKDKKKDARKRGFARRKVCRFCADANVGIDYKDPQTLKHFITDRGKIIPRQDRDIDVAVLPHLASGRRTK